MTFESGLMQPNHNSCCTTMLALPQESHWERYMMQPWRGHGTFRASSSATGPLLGHLASRGLQEALVSFTMKSFLKSANATVQDLPGALNDAAVAEGLNLHSIKNRDWAIFKTSAIKGEGLFEGLDWLSNQLKTKKR